MNYLLDTHSFLWWLNNDKQLSKTSKDIIQDGRNRIFLSSASQWEISIKTSIGRLEFPVNELENVLKDNGFETLSISMRHIIETANLPMYHRDPFDRMLIAQARLESLSLISKDAVFPSYDVPLIW